MIDTSPLKQQDQTLSMVLLGWTIQLGSSILYHDLISEAVCDLIIMFLVLKFVYIVLDICNVH